VENNNRVSSMARNSCFMYETVYVMLTVLTGGCDKAVNDLCSLLIQPMTRQVDMNHHFKTIPFSIAI